MPETTVLFFEDEQGACPLLDWIDHQPEKVRLKCIVRVERLAEKGHELRRPEADTLRDGIHELRVRSGHVNYRMLYFFHEGRAVVTHGLTKEGQVPNKEIDLAVERMNAFKSDPARHTHEE
mgnify:CR=1 FL=1